MQRHLNLILAGLLAGITLALYWPAIGYETVAFDDGFFTEHPEVQSGLNGHSLLWAITNTEMANWHPVTSLSFVLMHQFFGNNPGAEHLLNAAIHAVNAGLLFFVLWQLTGARWRSALVAALFAWHPLRVESVAWIAERKDVLCASFMLLTLWAYGRHVQKAEQQSTFTGRYDAPRSEKPKAGKSQTIAPTNVPASRFYWLALGCFALGLMSKAMVVTLPCLLLLLDIWPFRRFPISDFRFPNWKRLLLEKIPFLVLTLAFCVITYVTQQVSGATPTLQELGLGLRLENIVVSYLRYLFWTIWPAKLAVFYSFPYDSHFYLALWPGWLIGLGLAGLIAVSALCVQQIRRRPYLAVGWFWYLGTLVPVIGLVQIGGQGMADRYTYIPLIGPAISLVWLATEMAGSKKILKALFGGVTAVMLAACLIQTRHQLQFWKNTDVLFTHAIEVTGENPRAEYLLGLGLEQQGRLDEAMLHYRNAVSSQPRVRDAFMAMGRLLGQQGRWAEAEQVYATMLVENPKDFYGHLGLVATLPHLGRTTEAEPHLKIALQTCPNTADALNNLAWTLATSSEASLRDGPHAVELAKRACELTGYRETIMVGTLGAAYAETGQFEQAIATAQHACALASDAGKTVLLNINQKLLEIYQRHQAYHETSNP